MSLPTEPFTLLFVKGGQIELVPEDNSKPSKILEVADGKALYMPENTHNVINISTTDVVIIENEIK